MSENKNDNTKIEVPVLSFEEYQKMLAERKPLPRNYKIREEDKERFLASIGIREKELLSNLHFGQKKSSRSLVTGALVLCN